VNAQLIGRPSRALQLKGPSRSPREDRADGLLPGPWLTLEPCLPSPRGAPRALLRPLVRGPSRRRGCRLCGRAPGTRWALEDAGTPDSPPHTRLSSARSEPARCWWTWGRFPFQSSLFKLSRATRGRWEPEEAQATFGSAEPGSSVPFLRVSRCGTPWADAAAMAVTPIRPLGISVPRPRCACLPCSPGRGSKAFRLCRKAWSHPALWGGRDPGDRLVPPPRPSQNPGV